MNIGNKIRQLRIKNGLTQEELAARAELTKGFISQVERDITSLSISTLVDVLECLGTNLKDFFSDYEDDKIVFSKEDVFIQEDKELGNSIQWIVPNAQKNEMEPIILSLAPGGSTDMDDPHAGEEFGFVLAGAVLLHLGQQKYKCKKGESFYYKANNPHKIENVSQEREAKILWVSTPPSF